MAKKMIQHRSLAEEVYQRLLRQILDGKLPVGSRMREEKLCAELGVSRTPLREALIKLVREDILEQQPRRGCVVRQLPAAEIAELLECRRMVECQILREWPERLDRKRLTALRDRLDGVAEQDSREFRSMVLAADEGLHELILAACPNRFMTEHLRRLQLLSRPYRVLRCAEDEDLAAIKAERRQVITAILDGDFESAERGLAAHFESSRRYYLETTAEKKG